MFITVVGILFLALFETQKNQDTESKSTARSTVIKKDYQESDTTVSTNDSSNEETESLLIQNLYHDIGEDSTRGVASVHV